MFSIDSRACILFSVLVLPNSGFALNWEFQRGISLGLTYLDNVDFTSEDAAEGGGVVNLSPSVALEASGSRSQLLLTATGIYRAREDEDRDERASAEVSTDYELQIVEDLLSTRLNASLIQVTSDPGILLDSAAGSVDTSNQYSASFNYNLTRDIFSIAHFDFDHTFSVIENSDDLLVDSRNQTAQLGISDRGQTRDGWALESRYQRTDFDQSIDPAIVYSVVGEYAFFLSNQLLFGGYVGNEWTETFGLEDQRETIWGLALEWRPNAQHTFELGYAQRSFGSSPSLEYTLAGRRSSISLYWRKDYANTRVTELGELAQVFQIQNELTSLSGTPEHFVSNNLQLVDEEIGATFDLSGRLSDVALSAAYIVRENQIDRTEIEDVLLRASFSRRLNAYTDWEVGYTYRESLPSAASESLFDNRIDLSINYSR